MDEEIELSYDEEVAKLRLRVEEIKATIKAVEHSLRESGYDIKENRILDSKPATRQSGIRIKNRLSERGMQMSKELFEVFDQDNDNLMNLYDFRAMVSLQRNYLKPIHEVELSNIEAWKMYMKDNNFNLDTKGNLTVDSFINYRKSTELNRPLATELSRLNLGFLPKILRTWAKLKESIEEKVALLENKNNSDLRLYLDDVSYVLVCSGLYYTKEELFGQMITRAYFEKVIFEYYYIYIYI